MKNKGIFTAIVLITIGLFCLLRAFGMVDFSWWALFKLWPLILIWIGVNFIPISDQWKLISKILILLLGIVLLFVYSNSGCCSFKNRCYDIEFSGKENSIEVETAEYNSCASKITSNDEDITYNGAKLHLTASAGELTFTPSESLFGIEQNETAKYFTAKINKKESGDKAHITATLSPKKDFKFSKAPQYNVLLSNNPVWEMVLDLNATASDLDLSVFKVKDLKIEANASAVDLKLGNLCEEVNINIESNASAVKLKFPKEMKLIINKDNVLSSMNVSGFKKQKDGSYISKDVPEPVGTIRIDVDANVSSVEVRGY